MNSNYSSLFPEVDPLQLGLLKKEVSREEIRAALFSMGALKSPGPNGLNALFYQNQWEFVGTSMIKLVKQAFTNPTIIADINHTYIVLIPKKDCPETIRDFRFISLDNVIYKIISKVVVNRMKCFLPSIISPNQCSFVPGQTSSNNIIVAQEVINTMRTMSGKRGFMAIKIDLEKAYG
ncbi:uncharacterized protein LOC114754138 [Neltuma alba]|uniref:uncharacterized protein LOC114754138 n=1 Tax=Neltuma alba TaxID=207710 RepID=UPI0010A42083|nr:uncharacterized protein LOC114754138 [Prosopis alba]